MMFFQQILLHIRSIQENKGKHNMKCKPLCILASLLHLLEYIFSNFLIATRIYVSGSGIELGSFHKSVFIPK